MTEPKTAAQINGPQFGTIEMSRSKIGPFKIVTNMDLLAKIKSLESELNEVKKERDELKEKLESIRDAQMEGRTRDY